MKQNAPSTNRLSLLFGSVAVAIGPAAYVRFHGATHKYAGRYQDTVLDEWAAFLADQARAGRRIYAYFNNDVDAQAPTDAQRLRARLATLAPEPCGAATQRL